WPLAAASVQAPNPAGIWLHDEGQYKIQVSQHAGRWRATILVIGPGVPPKDTQNPDLRLRGRDIVGTDMFWNLRWNPGEGKFTGGTLYASRFGKHIPATAWLDDANTLRVQGRVLLMTRTLTFKRTAP
ncbi:DUF2147 domain-containing protein, partial [Hymenobacter agri]